MILYNPNKIICALFSIFNPFPRRFKIMRNGKYVLDIRGRWLSNKIQKQELARRKLAGEEERQCFKIYSKGSVEMSGSTE
jgi:hypothetical protein